jgi:hypothetical protein
VDKFKAEGGQDPACANVAEIAYVNKDKSDSSNLRMLHKTCKHCHWKSPQWIDIVNDANNCANEPAGSDRKKITRDIIYPTVPCTLEGVEVRCPKDAKKYLELYYGKTFMTPMYTTFKNGQWVANAATKQENTDRENKSKLAQKAAEQPTGAASSSASHPAASSSAAAAAHASAHASARAHPSSSTGETRPTA